jgi:predicted DNA-binding protein YlxM (UPF0122 family)
MVGMSRPKGKNDSHARVIELKNQGFSTKEICEKLNLKQSSVYAHIKRNIDKKKVENSALTLLGDVSDKSFLDYAEKKIKELGDIQPTVTKLNDLLPIEYAISRAETRRLIKLMKKSLETLVDKHLSGEKAMTAQDMAKVTQTITIHEAERKGEQDARPDKSVTINQVNIQNIHASVFGANDLNKIIDMP